MARSAGAVGRHNIFLVLDFVNLSDVLSHVSVQEILRHFPSGSLCQCCVGFSLKNWNVSTLVISDLLKRGTSSAEIDAEQRSRTLDVGEVTDRGVPDKHQRDSD